MGFIHVFGPCCGCSQPFFYNPVRVPSVRIKGVRQPLCEDCIARANVKRIANGLPPLVPLPGAYEPCDESEMPWPDEAD